MHRTFINNSRLLLSAVSSIPIHQLKSICEQFKAMGCAECKHADVVRNCGRVGAVKLAVKRAQAFDPDNLALLVHLNKMPAPSVASVFLPFGFTIDFRMRAWS